jgi:hypothetical protein
MWRHLRPLDELRKGRYLMSTWSLLSSAASDCTSNRDMDEICACMMSVSRLVFRCCSRLNEVKTVDMVCIFHFFFALRPCGQEINSCEDNEPALPCRSAHPPQAPSSAALLRHDGRARPVGGKPAGCGRPPHDARGARVPPPTLRRALSGQTSDGHAPLPRSLSLANPKPKSLLPKMFGSP